MPDEKPDEKPDQPVKTESNHKTEPVGTTEVSISSAQATINQDLLLVSPKTPPPDFLQLFLPNILVPNCFHR